MKKWETSVGPRCLSNGSTSSPRFKMECSQRATPIMIGKHNRIGFREEIKKKDLKLNIALHVEKKSTQNYNV